MSSLEKILTETRDMAQEMRDDTNNNIIERIQYSYQTWILQKMLDTVCTISGVRNKIKSKQK